MAEEKKEEKKGSLLWLWVLVAVLIVAAGIWYFMKSSNSTQTVANDNTSTDAVTEKHPDWQSFEAKKYKLAISHPAEYTVTESEVGNLMFKKDGEEIVDMYVTSAAGSDPDNAMASQERNFTNDDMKIMITDEVVSVDLAGVKAKQANGVFGKNGGINLSHEGIAGSAIFFIEDEKMFVFDSYDKGDAALRQTFVDMVDSINF